MKLQFALIAGILFLPVSLYAQAPAGGTTQKPTAHSPATRPAGPDPSVSPASADAPATEKIDPAKEAAIRHLMDVTETSKLGDRLTNALTIQVRSVVGSTLSEDRLDKFMESFSQKFAASAPASAVTDAVVPVYARHFSMDDIQGLIQFYESPLGQRLVKAMPVVAQESQNAGMQIDEKAALAVLRGMTDEYPQLKQLLPADDGKSDATPAPNSSPGATPAPQPQH